MGHEGAAVMTEIQLQVRTVTYYINIYIYIQQHFSSSVSVVFVNVCVMKSQILKVVSWFCKIVSL